MHRLLVDTQTLSDVCAVLPTDAARHLHVVRPRDGEEIELFDACGASRLYRWSAAKNALEACAPRRVAPVRPASVTLFACVTKGERWDWTIEKATELGASRLVPVLSERTIVRLDDHASCEAKRARWQKIADEAMRQSHALWRCEIVAPVGFAEALALCRETVCFAGALVEPPAEPLLTALETRLPGAKSLSLFVGPEGDFTPEELSALLKVAVPASFGARVLRAETAAIYGLTVIMAALDAAGRRKEGVT